MKPNFLGEGNKGHPFHFSCRLFFLAVVAKGQPENSCSARRTTSGHAWQSANQKETRLTEKINRSPEKNWIVLVWSFDAEKKTPFDAAVMLFLQVRLVFVSKRSGKAIKKKKRV